MAAQGAAVSRRCLRCRLRLRSRCPVSRTLSRRSRRGSGSRLSQHKCRRRVALAEEGRPSGRPSLV